MDSKVRNNRFEQGIPVCQQIKYAEVILAVKTALPAAGQADVCATCSECQLAQLLLELHDLIDDRIKLSPDHCRKLFVIPAGDFDGLNPCLLVVHAVPVKKMVEAVRKPGSVPGSGYPLPDDGHSSGSAVTGSLKRPTRRHGRATLNASLLGLAPDGVYLASAVADGPGELLPHPFTLTCLGRRTSLCGTFPGVAPAGRYPASCPVEPGLSSLASGHLDYFNQNLRLCRTTILLIMLPAAVSGSRSADNADN